jgi:hypothetical protein
LRNLEISLSQPSTVSPCHRLPWHQLHSHTSPMNLAYPLVIPKAQPRNLLLLARTDSRRVPRVSHRLRDMGMSPPTPAPLPPSPLHPSPLPYFTHESPRSKPKTPLLKNFQRPSQKSSTHPRPESQGTFPPPSSCQRSELINVGKAAFGCPSSEARPRAIRHEKPSLRTPPQIQSPHRT